MPCWQAQETLLALKWPEVLLDHELCRPVQAGDLVGTPQVAGMGATVISGLRVRMGINTGERATCIPARVWLHVRGGQCTCLWACA